LDFFTTQPFYRNLFFPNKSFHRSFANGYRNIDNTFATAQAATRIIIGLNTAVFGAWTYGKVQQDRKLLGWLSENFTLSATNWRAGRYYTMLTSAFSHQDPVHFLFNMIAFNAFGGILMFSGLGGMHVASLCIGSAIAGSFAWLYQRGIANRSQVSNLPTAAVVSGGMGAAALGASGMVMGAG
jgi:membrane associated rhomboid family serine protease